MQERIAETGKRARYWFENLSELAQYLDRTPRTWRSENSRSHAAAADWDLKAGYDQAWALARNGWIEGAQKAQEALKRLPPVTAAPSERYDFYGHRPHVARFCAGAPDNMVRHAKAPHTGMGSVLTLVVPVNATADVNAKYMANFGLALAQYVNQLEADGVRVELIGAIVSTVSGWRVSHCWRIKYADQPLDLAVLAFAVGHPAMFRRLGFALRERSAAPQDWSYGHSTATRLDDVINVPNGAYVVNGMINAGSVARTPEKALEYITAQIERAIDNPEAE